MLDLVDILSVDELESAKQRCLKLAAELERIRQSKLAVQCNHVDQPTEASSRTDGGNGGNRRRAVTILKRDGDRLVHVGNYPTCAAACRAIRLDVGGDSAKLVLLRNGYVVDPQAA